MPYPHDKFYLQDISPFRSGQLMPMSYLSCFMLLRDNLFYEIIRDEIACGIDNRCQASTNLTSHECPTP
jgi:hypothetical protein